jgi:8-oxo-dGTP pyrophosphatase MutT (NUDIX family)
VNDGARDAATVCLLRDGPPGLEILMVRRTPAARFMGGAWVFPGGAVDETDGSVGPAGPGLDRWRAAAVRELVEETGIWLVDSGPRATHHRPSGPGVFSSAAARGDHFDDAGLRYFARWITPAPLPIRFDARFFVAVVPTGIDALIDGEELVDAAWVRPADALEFGSDGSWVIAFPTLKTVEFLSAHGSTDEVMRHLDARSEVRAIQPRLSAIEGRVEILIPGDAGFDAAGATEQDPDLMARLMHIVVTGGDVPPDFRPT